VQKACIDFELPATAQLAGRYKFLDAAGRLAGDIELDLDWEHWGKSCSDTDILAGSCNSPSSFRVVADSEAYINGTPVLPLNDVLVRHNFRDTYGIRVGGSYHLPLGGAPGKANDLILRGGFGYDTAAAEPGWLRADLDGAARTTITVGVGYRMPNVEIDLGGGASLEGSPTNPNIGGASQPCNPTDATPTCGSSTHQGPDPIQPLTDPTMQLQSPFNQGKYTSHYTLFMLGATTWF
jgi:long-subunit fatty acid transport protein